MSGTNLTINVGGGFYQSDSLPFANQRCVNLFTNVPQAQALQQNSLFATEGLVQIESTGIKKANANRGGLEFQNRPYFVNGNALYRVNKSTAPTGEVSYSTSLIGLVYGSGRVSMAENGTQLMIVADGVGYIYQPSTSPSFQQITDPGFTANGTPQHVVYIDRYFVVSTDAKKAIISAVGDGFSWNAVDFISAEADPDDVVSPFIHRNQLYLLGKITTEQFQNIGGAGVPFRRVNGFSVPVGCDAPHSVVNAGSEVYWVGRRANEKAAIWRFGGADPVKVSTTAIDNKLHELTETQLANIYAFAYGQRGNLFVHFTAANGTFVFNPYTGLWHERESEVRNATGNRVTKPCRISCVVEAYNDLIAGDTEDGRIGLVDKKVYTEYDDVYISYFTVAPLYLQGDNFSIVKVEALCETGVGNPTCPDPQVRLAISSDGVQYNNERARPLGRSGVRQTRPTWYKNGRVSQFATMRFTISDPVPRNWYAIKLKLKGSNFG